MIASERALFIMRRINELGVVNLKDIAAQMGTSEITVRRDFEKLEKQGKLRRVQGGATTNGGTDSLLENVQISTRLKANVNVHEKQLVGNYAAGLVADGECVYLDDGTSLLPLAEQLLRRRVRIVTNNTMILEMSKRAEAEVFLVGGKYSPHYDLLSGSIAHEIIEKLHFDHAFIGCFGASMDKQMAYTMETECMTIKALAMKNATKRHLLLDATKLTRIGFYAIAPFSSFDTIICNRADSLPENLPEQFVLV